MNSSSYSTIRSSRRGSPRVSPRVLLYILKLAGIYGSESTLNHSLRGRISNADTDMIYKQPEDYYYAMLTV